MQAQFEAAYKKRFSFLMPAKALVVEAVSVEAIGASGAPAEADRARRRRAQGALAPRETVRMFGGDAWHDTGLYRAPTCAPATSSTGRPSSPRPMPPRWSNRAGRRRSRRTITSC